MTDTVAPDIISLELSQMIINALPSRLQITFSSSFDPYYDSYIDLYGQQPKSLVGGGCLNVFYWRQILALDVNIVETQT